MDFSRIQEDFLRNYSILCPECGFLTLKIDKNVAGDRGVLLFLVPKALAGDRGAPLNNKLAKESYRVFGGAHVVLYQNWCQKRPFSNPRGGRYTRVVSQASSPSGE